MNRLIFASIYSAFVLPGLLLAPPAEAVTNIPYSTVIVVVGWVGSPCVALNEPDPATSRSTIIRTAACSPDGAVAIRYTGAPGQYVGVDVVEDGVTALACEVSVDGVVVMQDAGYADVSCLSRLP